MATESGLFANLTKATEKDQITWQELSDQSMVYRVVPEDEKASRGSITLVKANGGRASTELSDQFYKSVNSKTFASTTLDDSNLELLWKAAKASVARCKRN